MYKTGSMENISLHIKKICLVGVVAFALLCQVSQLSANTKITVGYDNNYPPYEFVNDKGEPDGYNIELIKAIAKELNIELEFRPGVWAELRTAFDNHQVDLLSGMFYTQERNKYYDFSVPHSMISYVVFTRKGEEKFETVESLSGKKVLTQKNDYAYEWLSKKDNYVIGVDSPKEAIISLSAGNYDCALLSKTVGLYYAKTQNITNLEISEHIFLTQRYCFAVQKNNYDLISQMNEGLIYLKNEGTLLKIQEKWFGEFDKESLSVTGIIRTSLYVLIPVAGIIIFLLIWTWQLRKQVRKSVVKFEIELQEKRKAERMQNALYKISESASAAKDLNELYANIHTIVNDLVPANNFYIATYDHNRDILEFPYFIDDFDTPPEARPPRRGLTEYVLFSGKALLCSPEVFMQMIADDKIDQLGAPSVDWLGIPLKVTDKVIGIIVVQSYIEGVRFTKDDENLLLFVSNQIAMAIERKRAEQEILGLNSELEMRVIDRTHQLEETLEELRYENAERKRTQEALEQAQAEIELALIQERELNEMKSRFISIVSHEYRTPLTVILSSTYLMEKFFDLQSKPEFLKSLTNIQLSVKSMTKLLDDVLTIGKSDAGQITAVASEINLIKFVQSIIDDMKLTDKHNHVFELKANTEKIIIFSDLNLLSKIFINLLSNAIKYSGAFTSVITELNDKDTFVEIKVIDFGIGIPANEREHLFKSYHRFKNVGAISGTGLGLSIVKRFVDTLRGTISVESREGSGSKFTVTLPKEVH